MSVERATLGAGCFWGAEAYFRDIAGVLDTRVGFATGTDGTTQPARIEVVQIDFDSDLVSYETLIDHFWSAHDPSSVDRQGKESGEGVRSAIFVHSQRQAELATRLKSEFNEASPPPSVTQIIDFDAFELAEDRHQRYLEKNKFSGCVIENRCSTEK